MDPLTVLSLASSIAQLLDFGASLYSAVKEIAETGQTVDISHLSTLAEDFSGINSSLQSRFQNLDGQLLSAEQQGLSELVDQCTQVSKELTDCLVSICGGGPKKSALKSVRAALRTIWIKDKIDRLAGRLAEYRSELTLRVILVLNSHFTRQTESIDSLRDDIVEVLSINTQSIRQSLDNHHAETIAAILTTRAGHSTAISGSHAGRLSSSQDISRTATIYKQNGDGENSDGDGVVADFRTTAALPDYTQKILDALHFREVSHRWSAISHAHKETFNWVWNATYDKSNHQKWDNLAEWLRRGRGCYWVCGKAGSGKSSLMKYIQSHTKTLALLGEWAEDSDLVLGSFYFWYAGSALQKSQDGLLRGLLLPVLRRRPQLAVVLFPDLCRSIISRELQGRLELPSIELHVAFLNLIRRPSDGLKICFIVDGVDEYSGDHNDICELFAEASDSLSVKMLVSSRPIAACVDKFSDYPRLKLQDLTRPDIEKFVSDLLGNNQLMSNMEILEPGLTDRLVNLISTRADGVFLWVILVVKSIIHGLQNYDTTADLIDQVKRLPEDLEKLYDHMLGSMEKQHRVLASKYFQLVLKNTEIIPEYPMTILQLSYADDEDYTAPAAASIRALSGEGEALRCRMAEGRLRSRCCGLVEVQDPISGDETRAGAHTVGFLHRTVVEFLQSDSSWSSLVSLASNDEFDVDLSVLGSNLRELKAMPIVPVGSKGLSNVTTGMARMLAFSQKAKSPKAQKIFTDLYRPELRKVLGHHWHSPKSFSSPAHELLAYDKSAEKLITHLGLKYPDSFIVSLGPQCPDLNFYTAVSEAFALDSEDRARHLAYLLMLFRKETHPQVRISIIRHFRGSSNYITSPLSAPCGSERFWNDHFGFHVREMTPWQYYLFYIFSITDPNVGASFAYNDPETSVPMLDMCKVLIDEGAPVKNSITVTVWNNAKTAQEHWEISAAALIMALINKIWIALGGASHVADTVAEKACAIESSLRDARAVVLIVRIEDPQITENSTPPRQLKLIERVKLASRKKAAQTSGDVTLKVNRESLLMDTSFPTLDSVTPWRKHHERRQDVGTKSVSSATKSTKVNEYLPTVTRWEYTKKSDRLQLLSPEDQELVLNMTKEGLTAKEKRKLLERMRELSYPRQEKVLECISFLRSSQSNAGDGSPSSLPKVSGSQGGPPA